MPNGNLLVMRLTTAEVGLYECQAKNLYGVASTSAHLSVVPTLAISLAPPNMVVDVNSTVVVPCMANAELSSLDVNYAWFYEVCLLWFTCVETEELWIRNPIQIKCDNHFTGRI